MLEIISSSVGSLTNPLNLANTFKSKGNKIITDKTIYKYLQCLDEAFIIESARRYDVKGKKYIDSSLKYYFTDVGIRNALVDFRQIEENHIMENIIYIELKRRGFSVDVGVVEKRDSSGRKQLEIDFIANKGNNKYYIQSALNTTKLEKEQQEKRSLLTVNDYFKKIVIVGENIKAKRDEVGIITMSVFDFLLNKDSLDY